VAQRPHASLTAHARSAKIGLVCCCAVRSGDYTLITQRLFHTTWQATLKPSRIQPELKVQWRRASQQAVWQVDKAAEERTGRVRRHLSVTNGPRKTWQVIHYNALPNSAYLCCPADRPTAPRVLLPLLLLRRLLLPPPAYCRAPICQLSMRKHWQGMEQLSQAAARSDRRRGGRIDPQRQRWQRRAAGSDHTAPSSIFSCCTNNARRYR